MSSFAPLPNVEGGFRCVAADPPWKFRSNSVALPGRNAIRHYRCLSPQEILSLPVKNALAEDAALFLWVPGPFLAIGAHIPVMKAWGFTPTAMGFTWFKLRKNATTMVFTIADFKFGPGLTTRKNAEFVVIGKRGRSVRKDMGVGDIIVEPAREHSRKPEGFYEAVERYCDGPRLELFARASRDGWQTWGDEATKYDQAEEAA